MKSINIFAEIMDHEFPEHNDIKIQKTGFKVDGDVGIKVYCKLNQLKSVDYFHDCNKDGLVYIEFSDLFRQSNQLKNEETKLKGSNLDKEHKRKLLTELHKKINSELQTKFKDSLHIMRSTIETFTDIPDSFKENSGQYVIIVAPLNGESKVEMAKLMDQWKNNITSALPRNLFTRIKILPLENFIN
ncbi:hypothetical protein [Pseudoalteromonas shioyasakiensis]|uniref:hypothetical protein n=1 Tax=Pseudoalteromonas shioyasakiensis TaxID=1190813 RepID=UPI002552094C|nr:hypothetical protein [Pseudoalteromonas shioyasakiensis]MDK9683996.1 hypothetical protein [Pseudoalteromonas shioyasakiensis]